ncbi:MAG: MFS transporter [Actinomycetota bacterium]
MNNRRALVLATAALAGSTAILDTSIVNLALPAIGKAFGTDASGLAWAVNAYVLPFAVSILAAGRLGDAFGRRRVLAAGGVMFAIGSAGCALAGSYAALLAMRAVQGLGGSLLMTVSLATVSATFDEATRPKALGIYFASGATAGAAGPIIGGVLTDLFGWEAMFSMQVPLSLAVTGAALAFLDRPAEARRPNLDLPGLGLATVMLGGVNFAILQANDRGWTSPVIVSSWLLAIAALALFIVRERTAAAPAVRLEVFRNRRFVASSLVGAAAWFALLSGTIQVAVYLQEGRGLNPTQSSLVILAWPLAALVVFLKSSGVVRRFGSQPTMFVALGISVLFAAMMPFFGEGTPLPVVSAIAAAGGAAIALSVTASTVCAVAEFPPSEAGIASGIFNSLRQVGSALGVAIPAAAYDAATGGSLGGTAAFNGSAWAFGSRLAVLALLLVVVAAVLPRLRPAIPERAAA